MSAHTPGPWTWRPSSENEQEWEINSGPEPRLGYFGWGGLALVFGSEEDPETGQIVGKANARLIAAAPELLAALYEVRKVLMVEHRLYDNHGWSEFVAEVIDPAIAKAEGRE